MPDEAYASPNATTVKGVPICKPGSDHLADDNDIVWVDETPVVFSKANSLCSAQNVAMSQAGFRESWTRRLARYIPKLGLHKVDLLRALSKYVESGKSRALVIGAGDNASTNDRLNSLCDVVVFTDVVLSPGVDLVCDGQELPFPSDSFDVIIVIAVLEHVLSPHKVVSEMHRVVRDGGLALHDSPFLQSVHMGAYDFTRFTDLGYRWLFKDFEQLERGCSIGPASALSWAISGFFSGFMPDRVAKLITRIFFFWVKYFDYLTLRSEYDSGAGYYFIGKKTGRILSKTELILEYRGKIR